MNKVSLHLAKGQASLSAVRLLQFLNEILNMRSWKYYFSSGIISKWGLTAEDKWKSSVLRFKEGLYHSPFFTLHSLFVSFLKPRPLLPFVVKGEEAWVQT